MIVVPHPLKLTKKKSNEAQKVSYTPLARNHKKNYYHQEENKIALQEAHEQHFNSSLRDAIIKFESGGLTIDIADMDPLHGCSESPASL